jgi:hypothetical protein
MMTKLTELAALFPAEIREEKSMQDYLKHRLKELEHAEKSAWAQLNFVLGQKEEVEKLFKVSEAPPAETGVKPKEQEDE